MKSSYKIVCGALVMFLMNWAGPAAWAQAAPGAPSKPTIGIHTVEITDSIKKSVAAEGQGKMLSLGRVADSMGQQLIDRIHNTRKFTVVSRSDLNTILKDQDLQRVLSDPSDVNVAQAFMIAGCKYALIVTIDDFQDIEEELRGEGGQVLARKRTVRLSAVAKIYDTTTSKLLESANFQLSNKDGEKVQRAVAGDGQSSDQLLTAMSREMAQRAANRVLDVIFPAKIIAKTGKLVTINRGDGGGIAKGEIWTVYATGEKLVDPDTGEVLGVEEIPIGKIRVINVTPKFSHAQIIEDYGIAKLQILRFDEEASREIAGE